MDAIQEIQVVVVSDVRQSGFTEVVSMPLPSRVLTSSKKIQ